VRPTDGAGAAVVATVAARAECDGDAAEDGCADVVMVAEGAAVVERIDAAGSEAPPAAAVPPEPGSHALSTSAATPSRIRGTPLGRRLLVIA
jgi:hypothetical protein